MRRGGIINRVRVKLTDEAAATAVRNGFSTAYVLGTLKRDPGVWNNNLTDAWNSFGGQTFALADLTPATLTAKDGQANVFELKPAFSTTTKAELTIGAAGGERDGVFGWVWGVLVDLKDNQKFKFKTGFPTSFFEMNICLEDGTTSKPWNCAYMTMPSKDGEAV